MRWFTVALLGSLLWLMLSCFANHVGLKAEEITTGNLLTNGNFETGNDNGWTNYQYYYSRNVEQWYFS